MRIESTVSIADIVNSLIALAALLISGIVAWAQFSEPDDDLVALSSSFDRSFGPLEYKDKEALLDSSGELVGSISRVPVTLNVYNPMDRNISVTGLRLFQVINGSPIHSSRQLEKFSVGQAEVGQELPFNIEPRTTANIRLEIRLPVAKLIDENCALEIKSMTEFETCAGKEGTDIFGNVVFQQTYSDGNVIRSWLEEAKSPTFILELTTAGGTRKQIPFSYYPSETSVSF